MEDTIDCKIDLAHSLLESIEGYAINRMNGLFSETVDKSVIEQLETEEIATNEWYLYRINELVYSEESGLRREIMENVLATFRGLADVNIIYIVLGDKDKINFYLGVAKNFYGDSESEQSATKISLGIETYATEILEPSLHGNFVGSIIEEIGDEDKKYIRERMKSAKVSGFIDGVPGIIEQTLGEKSDFQGVERLADTMVGTEFGLVVIATPCSSCDVIHLENQVNHLTNKIEPIAKQSLQAVESEQTESSSEETNGIHRNISNGKGVDTSQSASKHESKGSDKRRDVSTQILASKNDSSSTQNGKSTATSTSYSNPKSYTDQREMSPSNHSSVSTTVGVDDSTSYQISESDTSMRSKQWSDSENTVIGANESISISTSNDQRTTNSKNISIQKSYGESTRKGISESKTSQLSHSLEVEKKAVVNWLKYIDEVFLHRIDKGKSKGSFTVATYLFTPQYRGTLYRLANTVMALYGGEKGNVAPLQFTEFSHSHNVKSTESQVAKTMFENFQIPLYKQDEGIWKSLFSKFLYQGKECVGSWLTVDELGILMGMPQREVLGLPSRNEAEYGINLPSMNDEEKDNSIELGDLIHHGAPREENKIYLNRKHLNKHTFICGVTGSGKTTTCQSILIKSGLPFLVIEPAKTEYRVLTEVNDDDIYYFTLGRQDVAPFFLNPFELFPRESITSRADMIKATITSSFHMEAAMPQLIEAATYRVYEQKGWDIRTNRWTNPITKEEGDPFAADSYAFPTLSDFISVIDEVTKEQGFGDRLESEYLGSLRARLKSLLVGAKGMMLNTPRSIDFSDLVMKKVVIELEEIKDGAEKSLIMGFIITNLLEAVKNKHLEYGDNFKHLTLVEEAHRLLSKVDALDSPNKRQGVEIFADMLAEVRKYGESLIIVDQIPNKMTPEVLKNTSTKIVHKIFAQDDKDAIGNTMALKQEQKEFLSYLEVGRAIMITEGWKKPVQLKVNPISSTTGRTAVKEEVLRERALSYYAENNHCGVIPGLVQYEQILTPEIIEEYLMYLARDTLMRNGTLKVLLKSLVESSKQGHQGNIKRSLKEISSFLLDSVHSLYKEYKTNPLYISFVGAQLSIPYEGAQNLLNAINELHRIKSKKSKDEYIKFLSEVTGEAEDIINQFNSVIEYFI